MRILQHFIHLNNSIEIWFSAVLWRAIYTLMSCFGAMPEINIQFHTQHKTTTSPDSMTVRSISPTRSNFTSNLLSSVDGPVPLALSSLCTLLTIVLCSHVPENSPHHSLILLLSNQRHGLHSSLWIVVHLLLQRQGFMPAPHTGRLPLFFERRPHWT